MKVEKKIKTKLYKKPNESGRNRALLNYQNNTLRFSKNSKSMSNSLLNDSNALRKSERFDTDIALYSKIYGDKIKEEKKFESLIKTLNNTVFSDLKNSKNNKLEEFKKKNKIVNDLEKTIKKNKYSLENINKSNYLTNKKNNSLVYENYSLQQMNHHNDKEINSIKKLMEKMKNQIESFNKNSRDNNLEKKKN